MVADSDSKAAPPAKPRTKLPRTLGIVLGVAVAQGVAFFVIFKVAGGGPEAAHGEQSHAIEAAPSSQTAGGAEVALLRSFKVPNDKSGVLRVYDIDLSVVVAAADKARVETLVERHAGAIADCVAGIVRGATDRMLREDDLRVLRAQLLEGLREVTGDEHLIQRVLIPKFVPLRAE